MSFFVIQLFSINKTMKIFQLVDPVDLSCARLIFKGDTGNERCNDCGRTIKYVKPAMRKYSWMNGSDIVCDFVWPSGISGEVIVTEEVADTIGSYGVDLVNIEFIEEQDKRWQADYPKGSQIKLPYDGPKLFIAYIDNWISLDKKRSTIELISDCDTCKYTYYIPIGVEENKQRYNLKEKKLDRIITPRKQGMGIFVNRESLLNFDFFRIHETPGFMYCTEQGMKVIEQKGFNNILFEEMGETY